MKARNQHSAKLASTYSLQCNVRSVHEGCTWSCLILACPDWRCSLKLASRLFSTSSTLRRSSSVTVRFLVSWSATNCVSHRALSPTCCALACDLRHCTWNQCVTRTCNGSQGLQELNIHTPRHCAMIQVGTLVAEPGLLGVHNEYQLG